MASFRPEGNLESDLRGKTRKSSSVQELLGSSCSTLNENYHNDTVTNTKANETPFELKNKLGLVDSVAMIVGCVIGSGIFISPTNVLRKTGSPGLSLVMWTVCGVYSLLGALAYCEIGVLIPQSGGEFIYFLEAFGPIHKCFGPLIAFTFSWLSVLLIRPAGNAVVALAFANYLIDPVSNALGLSFDEYQYYVLTRIIAMMTIALITYVNCASNSLSTWLQNVFTAGKVLACLIVVGGGVYCLWQGKVEFLKMGFANSSTSYGELAEAFYGGYWAYDGWNTLNLMTEEIENPNRNLPLAIFIAVPLTTFFYVFMNISYLTILSPSEILSSEAVAVDWARKLLGPFGFLMPLGVIISIFGSLNGGSVSGSRLTLVAAREGHLPCSLSFIHPTKETPILSYLFSNLIAALMVLPGDIGPLIDMFGFTTILSYFFAMLALIVMRFTKKDVPRPIKVPIIIPVFVMLVSAYLVVGPVIADLRFEYVYALLFILLGVLVYVPFVYRKTQVPGSSSITKCLQKVFVLIPHPLFNPRKHP